METRPLAPYRAKKHPNRVIRIRQSFREAFCWFKLGFQKILTQIWTNQQKNYVLFIGFARIYHGYNSIWNGFRQDLGWFMMTSASITCFFFPDTLAEHCFENQFLQKTHHTILQGLVGKRPGVKNYTFIYLSINNNV